MTLPTPELTRFFALSDASPPNAAPPNAAPPQGSPAQDATSAPPGSPFASGFDRNSARMLSQLLAGPFGGFRPRAEIDGLKHLLHAGPAIVVINHTGMSWLRDSALLLERWAEHVNYDFTRLPRGFSLPSLIHGEHRSQMASGVRNAMLQHLDGVLATGGIVLWSPEEGVDVIGRDIRRCAGPFRHDFIELGAKHGAAVIPVACMGSDIPIPWRLPNPIPRPPIPSFSVGEPLRIILNPESASEQDYKDAAAAVRHIIVHMLGQLNVAHRHAAPASGSSTPPSSPASGSFSPPTTMPSWSSWLQQLPTPRWGSWLQRLSPPSWGSGTPAASTPSWASGAPSVSMPSWGSWLQRLPNWGSWSPHSTATPAAAAAPFTPRVPTPFTDPSLTHRVAALEAREEVSRAMFTWGRWLDRVERTHAREDAEHIAREMMTADGVMDFKAVGWGVWGPDKDELIAKILKFSRPFMWSLHTYPNGEIEVDANLSTAQFFTSTELVPLTRDGIFQWYFLTQRTNFRKVGDHWKVARYTLSDLRIASTATHP